MIKNRKGFSLITTVFLILFVSGIGAMVLSLSGKMIGETIIQHKKEQSILFAKSYTELAILAATANDCIRTLTATEGGGSNQYDISINITYLGSDINTVAGCAGANSIGGNVAHVNSRGTSILVDATVTYTDPMSSGNKKIRYYRRTIQKL